MRGRMTWSPVERGGRAYCCDGCARGGPCCCSYDDQLQMEGVMPLTTFTDDRPRAGAREIPMSPGVLCDLDAEIERLETQLRDGQVEARWRGFGGDVDSPSLLAT